MAVASTADTAASGACALVRRISARAQPHRALHVGPVQNHRGDCAPAFTTVGGLNIDFELRETGQASALVTIAIDHAPYHRCVICGQCNGN